MKSVSSATFSVKKHNINVFNNLFAVACNFLDEQNGIKTDFHNELYQAVDSNDETRVSYICMSCQTFFFKSIKVEHKCKKAQAVFEETQKKLQPFDFF